MSNTKSWIRITVAAAACGIAFLGGCSSSGAGYTAVSTNPTPELTTLDQRTIDYNNMIVTTWNENNRMILADFARAVYIDRPSRLCVYPMPH